MTGVCPWYFLFPCQGSAHLWTSHSGSGGTGYYFGGGILTGVFTATESAAVAVVYALFVSMAVYKEIHTKDLYKLFVDGAVTASLVLFIIATASVFS